MGLLRILHDRADRADIAWLAGQHQDPRVNEYLAKWESSEITVRSLRRQLAQAQESLRRTTNELSALRARCTTLEAARNPHAATVPADTFDNLAHLVATARSLPELRADAAALGIPL